LRQRSLDRHADRIQQYLKGEMERTGLVNLKNSELALRIQRNPPSVIIEDESAIPPCYKREELKITVLKTDIRNAMKTGANIPGVHLEQTTRLVIS
jgi:hypothetical protein